MCVCGRILLPRFIECLADMKIMIWSTSLERARVRVDTPGDAAANAAAGRAFFFIM